MIPQDLDFVKSKYAKKKKQSLMLAQIYARLFDRAERAADMDRWERKEAVTRQCGTMLLFDHVEHSETGALGYQVRSANFCRGLLCPLCQWRRAQKLFGDMVRVWEYIFEDYKSIEFDSSGHRQHPKLRAFLLTLTVKNCAGDELRDSIRWMQESWNCFAGNHSRVWQDVKGYYKTLEVTVSDRCTYHPHFHVLCLVTDDYFQKGYIRQPEWLAAWQQATGDDSITQLDIRVLKGGTARALLKSLNECCKYTVKPSDFLSRGDDVVETLDRQLEGVRRASYGGWLKEARRQLKLSDDEHIDDKRDTSWRVIGQVWLHWSSGLGDYVSHGC